MARSAYQLDSGPDVAQRWQDRAACRDGGWLGDPDAWFVVTTKQALVDERNVDALRICQRLCPVLEQCKLETVELRRKWPIRDEIRGGLWFDGKGHGHERAGIADG